MKATWHGSGPGWRPVAGRWPSRTGRADRTGRAERSVRVRGSSLVGVRGSNLAGGITELITGRIAGDVIRGPAGGEESLLAVQLDPVAAAQRARQVRLGRLHAQPFRVAHRA